MKKFSTFGSKEVMIDSGDIIDIQLKSTYYFFETKGNIYMMLVNHHGIDE